MADFLVYLAAVLAGGAFLLALFRFLRGPSPVDRVVAFDVLTVIVIAKLQELAKRRDIEGALLAEIENMTVDRKFYDGIHLPELGENPDDQEILQYAMMREFIAMVQYSELAEKSAPGPVRDLFQFMANEEIKHKNDLEALYYQIIHSGGV